MGRVRVASLAAAAVVAALPVTAAVAATVPTASRAFAPNNLFGRYSRFIETVADNVPRCPQTVAHFNSGAPQDAGGVIVPPKSYNMDGASCEGELVLTTSEQLSEDNLPAEVTANDNAVALVEELFEKSTGFWLGSAGRTCGKFRWPVDTTVVFFEETETITLLLGTELPPQFKYMFVAGRGFTCAYRAQPKTGPVNGGGGGGGGGSQGGEGGGATPVAAGGTTGGGGGNGDGDDDTDSEGAEDGTPAATPVTAPATGEDTDGEVTDSDDEGSGTSSDGEGLLGDVEPSPSDDDSECFPASARVTLADGTAVGVDVLARGHTVRVGGVDEDGAAATSEVFLFSHKIAGGDHPFTRLITTAGALTASSGHYVYANGALKAAGAVVVGDTLETAAGHTAPVISIESVRAAGLYAPHTLHGDVIVDGFRVSTYTTAVAPGVAHALLAPVRAAYRAGVDLLGDRLEGGSRFLASIAPKGKDAY
ncbi:hypothetical protein MMPV_007166 [Pyropia vietnamensis]